MRRTLAVLAPVVLVAVLACAGAAGPSSSEPADEPMDSTPEVATASHVLPWLAVSSSGPWPMKTTGATVIEAIDDRPHTAWAVGDGEVGAFFTPTVAPTAVKAMGSGAAELRLLGKPARGERVLASGGWQALTLDSQRLVETQLEVDVGEVIGFEVRAPTGGKVYEVRLIADGRAPLPTGAWRYVGSSRTSEAIPKVADWKSMRFGTLDVDACTSEKFGGGPGESLTDATCTANEGGVHITGSFPPFGAIDEDIGIVQVHPCLAIVDGYPHTRKGCRKLQ